MKLNLNNKLSIYIFDKNCLGKFAIAHDSFTFHLLIIDHKWGYQNYETWYDGTLKFTGFVPVFLYVRYID